jgi:hypothetical protein
VTNYRELPVARREWRWGGSDLAPAARELRWAETERAWKLNDPSPEEREARLVARRRARIAEMATGHWCAGDRVMKPGAASSCADCETESQKEQ